jgi:hypothetical protein
MSEDGSRNAAMSAANGGYAAVYNAAGYGIANIDRLARIDSDGDLAFVHEQIADNDDKWSHATTDEQWRSLIHLLDAAPSLLLACKQMADAFDHGDADSEAAALRSIKAAIAKAEPPQLVRHTVSVTVEVEIDTTPGEASKPGNVIMEAVEAVRDGEGTVVRHEIVAAD